MILFSDKDTEIRNSISVFSKKIFLNPYRKSPSHLRGAFFMPKNKKLQFIMCVSCSLGNSLNTHSRVVLILTACVSCSNWIKHVDVATIEVLILTACVSCSASCMLNSRIGGKVLILTACVSCSSNELYSEQSKFNVLILTACVSCSDSCKRYTPPFAF